MIAVVAVDLTERMANLEMWREISRALQLKSSNNRLPFDLQSVCLDWLHWPVSNLIAECLPFPRDNRPRGQRTGHNLRKMLAHSSIR